MHWLTEHGKVVCEHGGHVSKAISQEFVRVGRQCVLIEPYPHAPDEPIDKRCEVWNAPPIPPCTLTYFYVAGYSDFVRIGGKRVCTDALTGTTDGVAPGTQKYYVSDAGQAWVGESK